MKQIELLFEPRPGKRSLIAAAAMLFMITAGTAAARQTNPQHGTPTATSSGRPTSSSSNARSAGAVLVSGDEDYRIGVHDLLEIQIENAPELSREFRVTASGSFLMPYVGRVVAKNKTPEELTQFIIERLRGDYLKDPKVTVKVKEFNSRSFFIQGAVRNPNVYQIEGKPSLLELLTLAGGLAENHGANAYIIRKIKQTPVSGSDQPGAADSSGGTVKPDDPNAPIVDADKGPRYELRSANINGLLKGRFEQDVTLEPGDIINIPETDLFFVAGEVNAPGSFPLKEGTTIRQAISLAQGTKFSAATNRGVIYRENPTTGKQEEVKVDISAVMSGKKPDVPLMANDIVIVPNSRGKTIGGALLRAFGLNTVTRVPIY